MERGQLEGLDFTDLGFASRWNEKADSNCDKSSGALDDAMLRKTTDGPPVLIENPRSCVDQCNTLARRSEGHWLGKDTVQVVILPKVVAAPFFDFRRFLMRNLRSSTDGMDCTMPSFDNTLVSRVLAAPKTDSSKLLEDERRIVRGGLETLAAGAALELKPSYSKPVLSQDLSSESMPSSESLSTPSSLSISACFLRSSFLVASFNDLTLSSMGAKLGEYILDLDFVRLRRLPAPCELTSLEHPSNPMESQTPRFLELIVATLPCGDDVSQPSRSNTSEATFVGVASSQPVVALGSLARSEKVLCRPPTSVITRIFRGRGFRCSTIVLSGALGLVRGSFPGEANKPTPSREKTLGFTFSCSNSKSEFNVDDEDRRNVFKEWFLFIVLCGIEAAETVFIELYLFIIFRGMEAAVADFDRPLDCDGMDGLLMENSDDKDDNENVSRSG
jgi:hypothetical protein